MTHLVIFVGIIIVESVETEVHNPQNSCTGCLVCCGLGGGQLSLHVSPFACFPSSRRGSEAYLKSKTCCQLNNHARNQQKKLCIVAKLFKRPTDRSCCSQNPKKSSLVGVYRSCACMDLADKIMEKWEEEQKRRFVPSLRSFATANFKLLAKNTT